MDGIITMMKLTLQIDCYSKVEISCPNPSILTYLSSSMLV